MVDELDAEAVAELIAARVKRRQLVEVTIEGASTLPHWAAPEVLEPAVERLAQLAKGGRVLEFAIGTGRVAVPLAQRNVPVAGIEYSPAMIAELRTKVDEATISRYLSV